MKRFLAAFCGSMMVFAAPYAEGGIDCTLTLDDEIVPPSTGDTYANFGGVVGNEDWLFVSDPNANAGEGVVIVYERTISGGWDFYEVLTSPLPMSDRSGFRAIDFDGQSLLVRESSPADFVNEQYGSGSVHVYQFDMSGWEHEQTIRTPEYEWMHHSAALSGSNLVVAYRDPTIGQEKPVYVYRYAAGAWVYEDELEMPGHSDSYGVRVQVDGDRAYVADPDLDVGLIERAGVVHVFERSAGVWSLAQSLDGTGSLGESHRFGFTIAASDGRLWALSTRQIQHPDPDLYAVHIFEEDGFGDLEEVGREGIDIDQNYPSSISVNDTCLAFGYPEYDSGMLDDVGRGAMYEWDGASLSLRGSFARAVAVEDEFFGATVLVLDEELLFGVSGPGSLTNGSVAIYRCEEVILDPCDPSEFEPCDGDLNEDGSTDAADLEAFVFMMGREGRSLRADLNRDGVVDTADLAQLLALIGTK